MSHRSTIKRLYLLFQIINRGGYPSKDKLIQHLELHLGDGAIGISPRSLERSIQELRDEFDIFINYNRIKKGYEVDQERSVNSNAFAKFLELSTTAGFYNEALKDKGNINNVISFDQRSMIGSIWIKPLFNAILEKRKVEINHFSFERQAERAYLIQPLLLKEFNGRWYVIVNFPEEQEKMRTFALDRILDLKVLDENFKMNKDLQPAAPFQDILGVIYSMNHKQEIIFEVTTRQWNYLNSQPLHHSQTYLGEQNGWVRVSLDIIPNIELEQQFLMRGDTLRIISPAWLKESMKDNIKNMLSNYAD